MKNYITFTEDYIENGEVLIKGGEELFILDEDTNNYYIQVVENSHKTVKINKNDRNLSYNLR